jgi:tRNA(Arg) A34 adenosine deaminase TadA
MHSQDADPVKAHDTTDQDLLRLAIDLSRKGLENGNMGPIGAVIARDGVVLGLGHNRCLADLDITAHGEMVAIRDGVTRTGSLEGLKGATLYTTAQPCPLCYSACHWAGIARIVYALSCRDTYEIGSRFGFNDAALYADLRLPEAERSIPQRQLLREEALPVLQAWALEAEIYFSEQD